MNPLAVAILGYAVIVSSSLLLLFVLRALGKSTLWMPIEPAHVLVSEDDLSAEEAVLLEARSAEFNALGFRASATYRMTNTPRPILARTWLDSSRTIVATAQAMATNKGWEARFLEISSFGPGDTFVTTRNLPVVPVFEPPPGYVMREAIEARTPQALLAVHRATLKECGIVPTERDQARILDDSQRSYRRFCEFQEERGLVRRDAESGRWVGTPRAHVRLVLGQVLPSTADFDASRIRWALFAGTVLPVTLVMIAGRRSMLSQAAVFISEFVATVFFPARLVFQLIRR